MAVQPDQVLDNSVRMYLYRLIVETGEAPSVAQTADALAQPVQAVADSYQRLHDGHVVILMPGATTVRMANPFSLVPTPFRDETRIGSWWGNCAWDALGIAAAVRADATIRFACPDCQEDLALGVRNGRLESAELVAHFAVPAARWWDDIVFT